MGAKSAKYPPFWGDDLNRVEIDRDPVAVAPITVTDAMALAKPVVPFALDRMRQGNAPDPREYAKLGETIRRLIENDNGDGSSAAAGMLHHALNLAKFKGGHSLDAQRYGASSDYGNYTFGVYNAASGASLPYALDLANIHGKYFSDYGGKNRTMDKVYSSIPVENVESIKRAYKDYANGSLWKRP